MIDRMLDIMETSKGREFIWMLLEYTGADNGGFSTDPYYNAWLAGRASVGAELLRRMRETERGAELEYIMRREARHPPDNEDEEDFYSYFKEGEQE